MTKRILDLLIATSGLVVLAPCFIVIAVWIKLTSKGPVIFRQERVGRAGRPFCIYKFRTMAKNAARDGLPLTVGDDPRITRIGRTLRRTKLDELPQLVNVLLGDMSLVGPRPEVAKYVAHYPPAARDRILSIRPGITDEAALEPVDEAQVLGAADDPEATYLHEILPRKIELYERYVATRTLLLDLRIMARTLGLLVRRGRPARSPVRRADARCGGRGTGTAPSLLVSDGREDLLGGRKRGGRGRATD